MSDKLFSKNRVFFSELKFSLKVIWIIFSVLVLFILMLTFFNPELLISKAPVCISKSLSGEECFMCGSTRAFAEISAGRFEKASELNRMSIIVYLFFVINEIIFFTFIIKFIILKFTSVKQSG
ncbi:MAG: DUF2752 domain-containing protein [Ignavibacteria bacterium]|nr:DUF2752 domain-containing protein [Ignavibacteria bacterium]MBK7444488.1 DUF2752 domain-containing protein [Ignavibacteria bacterium]MBK8381814.1 DUF2752 domain-containing protein [Ignavibacteria bacterium]